MNLMHSLLMVIMNLTYCFNIMHSLQCCLRRKMDVLLVSWKNAWTWVLISLYQLREVASRLLYLLVAPSLNTCSRWLSFWLEGVCPACFYYLEYNLSQFGCINFHYCPKCVLYRLFRSITKRRLQVWLWIHSWRTDEVVWTGIRFWYMSTSKIESILASDLFSRW